MNEIRESKDTVIFIDELHTIVGAGGAEGAIDASNMLKPALARGELQCIGATTLDEYRKYIEKDGALERRFQPIMVDQPSVADTIAILMRPARQVRGPPRRQDHRRGGGAGREARRPLHERPLLPGQGDRRHRRGVRARAAVGHARCRPRSTSSRRSSRRSIKEKEAAIRGQEVREGGAAARQGEGAARAAQRAQEVVDRVEARARTCRSTRT